MRRNDQQQTYLMAKKRSARDPDLTDCQWEIMNVIWEMERATVAEVQKRLSERRDVSRNTVQTMMVRLEESGWLRHRAEGKSFVYRPAVTQTKARKRLMQRLVDRVFCGSTEGLMLALLEDGVSADQARRIREMIDQAQQRKES